MSKEVHLSPTCLTSNRILPPTRRQPTDLSNATPRILSAMTMFEYKGGQNLKLLGEAKPRGSYSTSAKI